MGHYGTLDREWLIVLTLAGKVAPTAMSVRGQKLP